LMKRATLGGLFGVVVLSLLVAPVQAVSVLFIGDPTHPASGADPAIAGYLESCGFAVTMFASGGTTAAMQQEAAMAHDVTLISQSIPSSAVVEGGVFTLQDVPRRVVSFEPYMFDDAQWTGPTAFVDYGNTGRTETEPIGLGDLLDTIYITESGASHPEAGGFSGAVQVYTLPYSVAFGIPGPEADVIATVDVEGLVPTTFVYATGAELLDGSIAPAPRIGLFLGQDPASNPETPGELDFSFISEDGLALLCAALIPEPSTFSLFVLSLFVLGLFKLRRRA
jgi:hypothetical protein